MPTKFFALPRLPLAGAGISLAAIPLPGIPAPPLPAGLACPRWPGCASPDAPVECCELADEAAELGEVDTAAGTITVPHPQTGEPLVCEFYPLTGRWLQHLLDLGFGARDARLSIRNSRERGEFVLANCGVTLGGREPGGAPGELPGTGREPGEPGEPARPGGAAPPTGPEPTFPGGLKAEDVPDLLKRLLGGEDIGESLSALAPVLAQIAIAVLGAGRAVEGIGPSLGSVLSPALQQLAQEQGGVAGAIETLGALILGSPGERAQAAARVAQTAQGMSFLRVLEAAFQRLRELAEGILRPVFDALLSGAEATVREMQNLYVGGIDEAVRPGGENVSEVAGALLLRSMAAGLTAQLVALLPEAVHPLKSLGMQQIAGFVADFGGFGDIASALRSPTVAHALRRPMEQRAAAKFRTNLPSIGEAQEAAAKRLIPLRSTGDMGPLPDVDRANVTGPGASYAEILRLHGFPEWWIDVRVRDAYREPRTFHLVRMLDGGGEFPADWLSQKIAALRYGDRDVEELTRAMLFKADAPGRGRLLSQAMGAYREGEISADQLERVFEQAVLREEHRALYRAAARMDRRGRQMGRLATRVLTQYRNDLVSRDVAKQVLASLGYADDEVGLRLMETDLDKRGLEVAAEIRETEAEVRAVKTQATANLTRQFRAGLVSAEDFLFWAEKLGYPRAWAENVLAIENLRPAPRSEDGEPAIGTGALEEAAALVAVDVRELVRRREVLPDAAAALLAGLGIPDEILRDLLAIARAVGIPTPLVRGGPIIRPEELEAGLRPAMEALARGLGERGLDTNLAAEVLRRLGLPEDVVKQFDDAVAELLRRLFAALF